MDSILSRYRNIIVLLLVIFAQLVLLAWQVKSDTDVPMVRLWAITAVTPVASTIESIRNGTTGFFSNYFELRNARQQSQTLHTEVDKLRLENQFLRNELSSAQRAESLAGFTQHNPSKMLGARVIGATPGANSRSLLIDRGQGSGVRRGMAVVTPDGIVGTVVGVFPFASQVRSVTDPGFAAGVESQKNHVHGVLKGLGSASTVKVDYVPLGQKIEVGEMLFTSGEDRIFPKGLPVGKVTSVKEGSNYQDILVAPSGTEGAPQEVLVILDPVHQTIPEAPVPTDTPVFLGPDVKSDEPNPQPTDKAVGTAADKLREDYKKLGDAQKHTFGEGGPGTPVPNFNLKVPGVNAPAVAAGVAPGAPKPALPPVAGATATTAPKPATTAVPATAAPGVARPATAGAEVPRRVLPPNGPATGTAAPPVVRSTVPPSAAAPAPAPAAAGRLTAPGASSKLPGNQLPAAPSSSPPPVATPRPRPQPEPQF